MIKRLFLLGTNSEEIYNEFFSNKLNRKKNQVIRCVI